MIGLVVLLGLLLLGVFAGQLRGRVPNVPAGPVSLKSERSTSETSAPVAPIGLQEAVEESARHEAGRNGVLIRSVEDGWLAGFRGATKFSQGSLRRIWLGAALLDAVDGGELSLDQRVPLLALKHNAQQPRELVGDLLRRAVAEDERIAQDHILDGLTGPENISRWLEGKGIQEVAYGPANRDLVKALERLNGQGTAGPSDSATPDGVAYGLAQLFAGRLLSGNSTRILLGYFVEEPTSASGVAPGWQILQMTGETREPKGRILSAGGVALVRSHSGRHFSIVVFAEGPGEAIVRRDRLLAAALAALKHAEMG